MSSVHTVYEFPPFVNTSYHHHHNCTQPHCSSLLARPIFSQRQRTGTAATPLATTLGTLVLAGCSAGGQNAAVSAITDGLDERIAA